MWRFIMTTQRDQSDSKRGFSSVEKDKQRELSTKGGRDSHSANAGKSESRGNSTRGGSPEQHAKAGRQSHKNS
jgi:hypothetical protein